VNKIYVIEYTTNNCNAIPIQKKQNGVAYFPPTVIDNYKHSIPMGGTFFTVDKGCLSVADPAHN
jgi:hypothetical protein